MGLMLAEPGCHTRCFVEREYYPRQSIIAAQRAGYFAPPPLKPSCESFGDWATHLRQAYSRRPVQGRLW
jgi:hypothetical protein